MFDNLCQGFTNNIRILFAYQDLIYIKVLQAMLKFDQPYQQFASFKKWIDASKFLLLIHQNQDWHNLTFRFRKFDIAT